MDAEVRKTGISGTDISAICGVNPFKSAFGVWLEKTGQAEPKQENPEMRWGKILEPVVATQFRQEHPDISQQMAMNKTTFVSPANPIVVGTPDYLFDDIQQGLEVKTHGTHAAARLGFGESGTDDVPKHHYLQCEWYMLLMGWDVWHLAALLGGQDYREYRMERDSELDERLVGLANAFWDKYVVPVEPPKLDGSNDVREYLKRRFATHSDMLPVATYLQREIYNDYWQQRQARDAAQNEVDRLENILKFQIGDTAGLQFENGRLTWKRCKDGTNIDWEAVAIAAGATNEQIAGCTSVRPGVRRFLAKLHKEG